jgi:MFS family permease
MSSVSQTRPTRRGILFRARVPLTSLGALICLWLVYAMDANTRQIFYYVIPPIVSEFKVDPTTIGIVSSLVTVCVSLLALPAGPWFDQGGHGWARKYRNGIVAAGYFVFSVLTGIGALTHSIWNVVVLQGIKNAFGGAGEGVEVTSAAEWFPKERFGFALGWQHTAYPWGTLLGAIATGAILAGFGSQNWRYVFLIIPLAMIPIWILYWLYATRRRYQRFEQETREMGLTLPLGEAGAQGTVKAPPGTFRRTVTNPNILVPAIASCFGIMTYTGISFWLPQYLAFVAHYNYAQAAAYSAVFTITGGVGQFAWGMISDHLGRKLSLMVTFCWLAVGIFLLQFTAAGLALLVAVQLFAGLATNAIYPVLYAYASDSAYEHGIGTANSFMCFMLYIGGVSPLILGALIGAGGGYHSATGYVLGLYFMVVISLISAVLIAFFTRETVGRFRGRDFGVFSPERCNVRVAGPATTPSGQLEGVVR